jgi:hypothetical protein
MVMRFLNWRFTLLTFLICRRKNSSWRHCELEWGNEGDREMNFRRDSRYMACEGFGAEGAAFS